MDVLTVMSRMLTMVIDSYLVKSNELWVVMEYMEGGALTDIIENNSLEEDQISSICLEVRLPLFTLRICSHA